ncbi:MAG: molybdenum cofactor biosynthesis protein MoaE [Thermoleophilia bacterium]
MQSPDISNWVDEVKARPDSAAVGMMLTHRGVVRGCSRSGEAVSAMTLTVDRSRLDEVLAEAETWEGVIAIRAWVNEGFLSVGDDIMSVLVAGDIRENVFSALQRLVHLIKTEVVSESEIP